MWPGAGAQVAATELSLLRLVVRKGGGSVSDGLDGVRLNS